MPLTRPTLAQLIARNETELQTRLGLGPLLKRSFLAAFARVVAGGVHLLYGFVAWAQRQLFPDSAVEEFLERWAVIFGVQRKAATFSSGTVTFTGVESSAVPIGTKIARVDGVAFETTAAGTITGGQASVAVEAVVAGADGDTAASSALTLASPVAGVDDVAAVDPGGLTGGADLELDEALRARLLARIRQAPAAGTAADYERWTLEVPGVTRAWALPLHLGPGTVGVTFAVDLDPDGPIPDSGQVAAVLAHLDPLKPVTADLTVFAPLAAPINPGITLLPDTAAIRATVEAALVSLLATEGGPGETVLVSHLREAISNATGELDHVLDSPTADVVIGPGSIATLGAIAWNGTAPITPDPAAITIEALAVTLP